MNWSARAARAAVARLGSWDERLRILGEVDLIAAEDTRTTRRLLTHYEIDIEGRVAVHDATYTSAGEVRKKFADFVGTADPEKAPGARHPLVRVHPATGRKALYLGRRSGASNVLGEADTALWDALWAHCTLGDFAWAHDWAVGDLLIWDNRCLMHYRESFDNGERRMMHRTQTRGEAPIAA